MAEIVRQHFAYSGAERILHCRSLQINRSFETWSAFVHFVVVFIILETLVPSSELRTVEMMQDDLTSILAANTVWYMWHYRSRLRVCPRGTQQTDLSEIQTTLGMLCNLFLISRLRSRPPPPISSSNTTRMFLRHWFFGSCDWIKLWLFFFFSSMLLALKSDAFETTGQRLRCISRVLLPFVGP